MTVLAFSLRRTRMEVEAAAILLFAIFAGTLASIVFPTLHQTRETYWANVDAKAFCEAMMDSLGAAAFWAFRERVRWAGWIGTIFFLQLSAYVAYVAAGHSWPMTQAVGLVIDALCFAKIAIVGIAPRWPQIVGAWRELAARHRGPVAGQRGLGRVGVRAPEILHRFPGEKP